MKILQIIALIFLVLFIISLYYLSKVKQPEWKFWILDEEHPRRFVDIATDSNGNPHIVYMNEKDGGGLLYITSATTGNWFLDDLNYYFKGREWKYETIDNRKNVGFFISITIDSKNRPHVAYQDSSLGREKLLYAYKDKEWHIETVDKAEESGVNVGMYASISLLKDKPIIFYHIEQGRKFKYAIRDGGWKKYELAKGVGWLITSDSCDDKSYVAYRERDKRNIFFAILQNKKFKSTDLNVTTSSGIALKTLDCIPYIAYFDDVRNEVMFSNAYNFKPIKVGNGKISRVSLDANKNGFYIVYNNYGGGLIYAYSKNGLNFSVTTLAAGRRDGEYNAISVSSRGNIYVAYLNRTALKYAEYNVTSVVSIKLLLTTLAFISLSLALVCLFISKKFY